MANSLSAPATKPGAAERELRSGPMLLVLLTGVFVAQFDFFVVNVAAPSIQHELHAGTAALQLIVGGYAFAYASGMVTAGRLGDMFGHRRLFVIGVLAFGATSLLCGVAPSPGFLVAARLAQGLAGSVMVPQTMGMITTEFPAERRATGLAGWGMAAGLGSIAGQVLGGLLVQADVAGLGWRLIFLINVPICAVAAALAPLLLPGPSARRRTGLDPLGAVGTLAAVGLFLVPLVLGPTEHWPVLGWVSMAAGLVVAVGTLRWQTVLTKRGGSPIIDMSLFRVASFRAGLIAGVCFMLYFGSFMFILTLALQSGLRQNAFHAGLIFCPMGLCFGVTSFLGRRIKARFGQSALVGAALISAVGLALLALGMFVGGASVSVAWIMACLCLIGAGNGVVLPSLIGTALTQVRPHQAGVANGVLQTAQQFSSSAGVAIVGAIFFALIGTAPAAADYARAMGWGAAIDLCLVLLVTAMVWQFKRIAESR